MRVKPGSAPAQQGVGALYPFLYADRSDLDGVLAQLRRSTVAKAQEIVQLREQVLDRYAAQLATCARAMATSFAAGGRLLAFGNGGSSTDAQDVASTFLQPGGEGGRPLPALSLAADIAVVTALSNDVGFDVVFSRQLAALGRPGDVAFGLSTSGNSENLLSAFAEASRIGMVTVGLTGGQGGKMAATETVEHLFVVPSASVHRIQEAQTTVYHVLWELTQHFLDGRQP